MHSIFISGIPKGLDQGIVSLRIRKDIETVAQVKTIEIQKEKGFGFVSLLDETSADFVLSLNKKICINGNPLRIRRWRRKSCFSKASSQTGSLYKQQTGNDAFVLRGYDTYTDYKRHRPQTDVLYQYIQQSPKQKKVKRKPWKDINRLSQLLSPKSRKTVRTKKRKNKKTTTRCRNIKHSTPSSKVGLHFASDGQRRTKFFCSAPEDDCSSNILRSSKNVTRTKNVHLTKMISENALSSVYSQSYATVHVYDHSKRVCSIEVDNNNLLESIRAGLKNKQKLPSDDTVLITHNGKTVYSQWQPKMENDDNIHIVVKGKGGMMQGDPPDGNDKNVKTKTTKDKCNNETDGSEATGFSADTTTKNIGQKVQHWLRWFNPHDVSVARILQNSPLCTGSEEKIESMTEEDIVDNDITNTTGTGSTGEGSADTASTANESSDTGFLVVESNRISSNADESDRTGSTLKETPGTECTAGESAGRGISVDDPTDTGFPAVEPPRNRSTVDGTELTVDDSAETGSTVNETAETASTTDESAGTRISVDNPTDPVVEAARNRSTVDKSDGTALTVSDSAETGSTVKETAGTASTTDESTVKDEQENRLQQVIESSPFASAFSQGSEAHQTELVEELHLSEFFPDQLRYESVMSISDTEKDEADTLADIPRLLLRKLIMLDFTSREHDLNEFLLKIDTLKEDPLLDSQESNSSVSDEDDSLLSENEDDIYDISLNLNNRSPVDIFLSIFVCLHPTLKQKVCLKMFACHLAIPIIFPFKKHRNQENTLLFSISPLRLITVYDGQRDTSLINCKQNIVSFVRLGRPKISKSKLANEILYETTHNAFFNRDCKLGSHKKQASLGLVEASWFVTSPMQCTKLRKVALFLNLRGDAFSNAEQIEYLKRVSRVVIIVTDKKTLKNKTQIEHFKYARLNVVLLLKEKVSKTTIKKYKEKVMRSRPDEFNIEIISVFNQGLSEIKETILSTIGPWLNDMTSAKSLIDISDQARTIGITVDDDMHISRQGRNLATRIFDRVKDCSLSDFKKKLTPLQKQYWNDFTFAMKQFCKPSSSIQEKEKIKKKMELQRRQQWNVYENGNEFIKEFINIFSSLKCDSLVAFLDSLKFELDENFRKKIPTYRKNYAAACDAFKSKSETDKVQAEKEVSITEQKLSEASFGMEHIFRELGQIYEASLIEKETELGSKLAKAVARSIALGYSFELLDGDVANVPLGWVERIFEELKEILGDIRLLTLSILGLQSSGKSTLLNTMFGLTFPVSAGRCTRGIYLQLFPVQKEKFNFDYVLVVDTEGLRAPELGETKQKHDNELAALVIGMADITIVNIKGENTSELKDILQICIHAFLQLKMANESWKLRPSCIFIHQNVSDVGAKDAMIHGRKKLDETLDQMTLEAAEEENICDIECFKDVINFDSNKHVWYFSDLWKGDPPMAPANPGYSRDVRRVKSYIFETLVKDRHSYLSISDTFVRIKDLWNGILANDFVFSFRNTLEIKAYNALETQYQDIIWTLERFSKELIDKAEVEMKQCTAICEKDKVSDQKRYENTKQIHDKSLEQFRKKQSELKLDLEKYFDESDKREEIAKWKEMKLCSWDMLTERDEGKLNKQLINMESNCKLDYAMTTNKERLKKEIYDQAKTVAEQMKGTNPSPDDMKAKFKEMWDKWIRTLDVQEESAVEIESLLGSILFETFEKHKTILQTELEKQPLGHDQPFEPLGNSLNNFKFQVNHISVEKTIKDHATHVNEPMVDTIKQDTTNMNNNTTSDNLSIDTETNADAIRIANEIFRNVSARLEDLRKKDWKVHATEIKEILKNILQHIKQHNSDEKKTFKLLKPYDVKLCVHVFRMILPLLKEMDREYRENHGIKAKLERYQSDVWCHFLAVVEEKSATIIACDRFCEVIRKNVEEKVKLKLTDMIHEHMVRYFEVAKFALIAAILEDLANINKHEKYLEYISDPYTYTFKWLTELINKKCFGQSGHLYLEKASAELQAQFSVVTSSVKENAATCLNDWLTNVQNGIKDKVWIQIEAFSVVKDQKVTDLDDFKTIVSNKLRDVEEELKDSFGRETVSTIQWLSKETPYKMTMDKLWGCEAMCPFCKEPCKWMSDHEGSAHSCVQHRAQGVSGRNWFDTNKLVLESCSFNVHSTTNFQCSKPCEDTVPSISFHFHPYKDYKKYYPDWDITPCPDISSSKYWAWVLCTFNDQFAASYHKIKADIPESWKEYTKDDAIKSLRQSD